MHTLVFKHYLLSKIIGTKIIILINSTSVEPLPVPLQPKRSFQLDENWEENLISAVQPRRPLWITKMPLTKRTNLIVNELEGKQK